MEHYVSEPSYLRQCKTIVLYSATAELFCSVALILSYFYWTNITTLYSFLILFQLFHVLSWCISLNIGYGTYSTSYISLGLVIYILSLMSDFVSLIWRAIMFSDCSFGSCGINLVYTKTQLSLVVILFVIDIILLLSELQVLAYTLTFVFNLRRRVSQLSGSNDRSLAFYKVPGRVFSFRKVIGLIWSIEFWLVILMLALLIFGFGINSAFNYIAIFLIPHLFLWTISRMVSGTPDSVPSDAVNDTSYLFGVMLLFGSVFLVDISGIIFGSYQISTCFQNGNNCNTITESLSIGVLFVYLVIAIFSAIQTFGCYIIERDLSIHQLMIFPHVETLLSRQYHMNEANAWRMEREREVESIVQESLNPKKEQ